jgi:hypothetical protein
MTIPFIEPPKYYKDEDELFYWMVSGDQVWQFNEGFFNPWKPGSELHYYKKKELLQRVPINDSVGENILRAIVNKIEVFIAEKQTV